LSPAAWLRFDLVRDLLEAPGSRRVLEIGPGRGAIAARLVVAGDDYTGIERSAAARRATAALLAPLRGDARVLGSLDELADTDEFDLLCAFEVLEHVEDDAGELARWVGRLRPGGDAVLSVPAWPDRFSVTDEEVGHLRRYTPEQLRDVATGAGLEVVELRLYGAPLGWVLERARDVLTRRARRRGVDADASTAERTERSGQWHQPPRWANQLVRAATWPFRRLQRRWPTRGTGLVLHARVPGS
jgi:SAM-dependent methyltransferase